MAEEDVQAMEISVCKWYGYHSWCITSRSGCSRTRQSQRCPRACSDTLSRIFNYHGCVSREILHVWCTACLFPNLRECDRTFLFKIRGLACYAEE